MTINIYFKDGEVETFENVKKVENKKDEVIIHLSKPIKTNTTIIDSFGYYPEIISRIEKI